MCIVYTQSSVIMFRLLADFLASFQQVHFSSLQCRFFLYCPASIVKCKCDGDNSTSVLKRGSICYSEMMVDDRCQEEDF